MIIFTCFHYSLLITALFTLLYMRNQQDFFTLIQGIGFIDKTYKRI